MTLPSDVDPRLPVLVGVGQVLDRDGGPSPVELMTQAGRLAESDAGVSGLLSSAEVIAAVPVLSWRYRDPGVLLASSWNATPRETWYPAVGGNTPQLLMNKAAAAISAGDCDVAVICGGESYRTRQNLRRAGESPSWGKQDDSTAPTWRDTDVVSIGHPVELSVGVVMPPQHYPLFENALRHQQGHSADEHQRFLGELWAGFSRVAASNNHAWDRAPHTAHEIATPSASNRMVGYPYTKHMVATPDVDMASAAILCSAEEADRRGITKDNWVFVWSGADANDPYLSERATLTSSAAMRIAGGTALDLAGIDIDDVAHLDVYSCFPSAVQIACAELGIALDRQLTVTGGLSFGGGPWNNPVGHAIASMADVLRSDPNSVGLVTANGGVLQKHSFGIYSTSPPRTGSFRAAHPQFAVDAAEPKRNVLSDFIGTATLESWTVMYERDGSPSRAHGTVLTQSGDRAWGVSTVPAVMDALVADDLIGRPVEVGQDSKLFLS